MENKNLKEVKELELELNFDIEKGSMMVAEMRFINRIMTEVGKMVDNLTTEMVNKDVIDINQIYEGLKNIVDCCKAERDMLTQQYEEEIVEKYSKGN